jgi:hypothetical protein
MVQTNSLHLRWKSDARKRDITMSLHALSDIQWDTYGEVKSARALRINGKVKDAYLVHASPGAFGSGTPEVAWIRDDFPELCEPITVMIGRSMSWSRLLVVS